MGMLIFVSFGNRDRKTAIPLTRIRSKRLFNKAGFSLLEFALVLMIVSALVIILIPKINHLQDEAHYTSVQLTANSLQTAVRLTHSLWQSQGLNNQTGLLKGYGRGNILIGNKGWPIDAIEMNRQGSTLATVRFAQDDLTCIRLWNGLLKDSAPKVGLEIEKDNIDSNDLEFIYFTQLISGTCRYRYHLNQGDLQIHYDLATGRVITLF
jgi:type II secretory pathway pseudopilin PulG